MKRRNQIITGMIAAALLLSATGCGMQGNTKSTERGAAAASDSEPAAESGSAPATEPAAASASAAAQGAAAAATGTTDAASETVTAAVQNVNGQTTESGGSQTSFPDVYVNEGKLVSFNCALSVPDEILNGSFSIPKVTGKNFGDVDKQYEVLVKPHESEITETYKNEALKEGEPDDMFYDFSDGSHASTGTGAAYISSKGSKYGRVEPDYAYSISHGLSHDTFSFGSAEDKVNEVKKLVDDMGYSSDQFAFQWYSLSYEERNALEQEALAQGRVEAEDIPDQWAQGDDTYIIYAWQNYQGLDVLPWYMTVNMRAAEMDFHSARLQAIVDKDGVQSFTISAPIAFQSTDQTVDPAQVLPFEKIAQTVENRFESVITDQHYTVNTAKMVLRTYNDENQNLASDVVWYLMLTDDSGDWQILMYNALTGEEIFLT